MLSVRAPAAPAPVPPAWVVPVKSVALLSRFWRRSDSRRARGRRSFGTGGGRWGNWAWGIFPGGLDGDGRFRRLRCRIGDGRRLRRRDRPALGQARYPRLRVGDDPVVLLGVFVEIGNVEEGVTIEADVHEGRLHAGQDPADPPFINPADQPRLRVALEVDFHQAVVFQHRDLRLMRRRGNEQLLLHGNSFAQETSAGSIPIHRENHLRVSFSDRPSRTQRELLSAVGSLESFNTCNLTSRVNHSSRAPPTARKGEPKTRGHPPGEARKT